MVTFIIVNWLAYSVKLINSVRVEIYNWLQTSIILSIDTIIVPMKTTLAGTKFRSFVIKL